MKIVVLYTAIDRYRERRTFKTLKGAQRFAAKYVGDTPELAPYYAISPDGIGTVRSNIAIQDLFPVLVASEAEDKRLQIEDRAYWEDKIGDERMSAEHQTEFDAENAWLRHAELGLDDNPRSY